MKTMKKYGLIFENLSVKVAEVVVNKDMYESFCTAGLLKELEEELASVLEKNNFHPIAIIPDTALNGGNYKETVIREATNAETEEYIFDWKNDWLGSYKYR